MLPFLHTSRVVLGAFMMLSVFVLAKSNIGPLTRPVDCQVTVSAPDQGMEGVAVVFSATPANFESYSWSVSSGQILSGQGTASITVFNLSAGSSCTATVQIAHQGCRSSSSATVRVSGLPINRPVEYGNVKANEEKAILDDLVVQVQNDPGNSVYLIGYGTCKNEGLRRANFAKDYLVKTRGIDPARVNVVDAGCRSEFRMQLWVIPAGAAPPLPDVGDEIIPCRVCKKAPALPTRRQRRRP